MKRCMNCKYWIPVDEYRGKCAYKRSPNKSIFMSPNYYCRNWAFWRYKNENNS